MKLAPMLSPFRHVVLLAARATRYHRRPQPPPHLLPQPPPHLLPQPPPPRNSLTIRSSRIAPMVALTIALITPVPRWIGQRLPEGQALKSARGNGWYIVDKIKGAVVDRDDELETLARRLSALEPYEKLADY
jgi:hypothetical protein